MATPDDERPVKDPSELLEPFEHAFTARADNRVGTEAEKFGVHTDTHAALPFDGPRGVTRVLELFVEKHGWQPQREHAGGEVISLRRDGASITLEPAAQLELSGAPFVSVHETKRELDLHLRELAEISKALNLTWLGVGFHPLATHEQLPHVPKLRYAIMRRYMPTRGVRSEDMMRRTCTVQANYDYSDASDAMRKLRVALAAQPITTALFANSPFIEGRVADNLSERAAVWLEMDRDRSGILPFAWDRDATLDDYVQYALDVPMFMVKRGPRVIKNTGQTFRDYMANGASGAVANMDDWQTHLNTLFPEARLKNTLEVRGADAQPQSSTCALPALWKGILYDEEALKSAETLIGGLDPTHVQAIRPAVARLALGAEMAGKPMLQWAQDLVEIARQGLVRIGDLDDQGRDEAIFLKPLEAIIASGETNAQRLRDAVRSVEGDLPKAIVERSRIDPT